MSEKRIYYMNHDQARQGAMEAIRNAPAGWKVTVEPPKRSREQNDYMWGLLTDISNQVQHCDQWLEPKDWKDLLTAHWRGQRMMASLDKRGLVALGSRTSRMNKKEMTEFIEFILAWGKTEAPVTVEFFDERQGVPA